VQCSAAPLLDVQVGFHYSRSWFDCCACWMTGFEIRISVLKSGHLQRLFLSFPEIFSSSFHQSVTIKRFVTASSSLHRITMSWISHQKEVKRFFPLIDRFLLNELSLKIYRILDFLDVKVLYGNGVGSPDRDFWDWNSLFGLKTAWAWPSTPDICGFRLAHYFSKWSPPRIDKLAGLRICMELFQ